MHYLNFKIFKQLPIQLGLSILFALLLGKTIDVFYVSLGYTISACFIEMLMFLLPLIVFSFIVRALVNIKNGSLLLLLMIFIGVTVSNMLALFTAYLFGSITLPYFSIGHNPDFAAKFSSSIEVLFSLHLPHIITTEKMMVAGIVSGLLISIIKDNNPFKIRARKIAIYTSDKISLFLTNIFIPLLPIYVFGFCLKLSYDDALVHLFHQYGKTFLLSISLVLIYITFLYLIGSKWNIKTAFSNIKTMLPAGLTGFSTMSSAATMPVTLRCTEENTKDSNFADLIIPSTANIHMLGDDLTIMITAMVLLSIFGMSWPSMMEMIPFALAFSVAKLSCVGIPGASVFVIFPVLQHYLGFTPEMVSILTTIYVLQDPFGTAANVMGNGAFALIVQKLFKKLTKHNL